LTLGHLARSPAGPAIVAALVAPVAFANRAIYFFVCAQIDPFSGVLGHLTIAVTLRTILPMPSTCAFA
jgi:hypothetical protein